MPIGILEVASSKSRTNEMTGHYWIGLIWHLNDTNALNSILNMFLLLKIYVSDRPVWSIHRMGFPNRDIAHNDQADKNIDFRLWWYPKTVVSRDGITGINGDSFYFICRIIDRQLSMLYIWIENLNVFRFECIQINVVGSRQYYLNKGHFFLADISQTVVEPRPWINNHIL